MISTLASVAGVARDESQTGWQRVTIPIELVHHAADQLLDFEVEALRPPALR